MWISGSLGRGCGSEGPDGDQQGGDSEIGIAEFQAFPKPWQGCRGMQQGHDALITLLHCPGRSPRGTEGLERIPAPTSEPWLQNLPDKSRELPLVVPPDGWVGAPGLEPGGDTLIITSSPPDCPELSNKS